MIIETLAVGPFQSNCTILGCPTTHEALIVDPGDEAPRLLATLARHRLRLVRILLTHGHLDHVSGVAGLKLASGAPVALHPGDRWLYERVPLQAGMFGLQLPPTPPLDEELRDGQLLQFGEGWQVQVLHTPGHSPGGVSFHLPQLQLALVGDTLFAGSIGRTDLWGGDLPTLLGSIEHQLSSLPPETRLICGHGPETTVARELASNPFLRPTS